MLSRAFLLGCLVTGSVGVAGAPVRAEQYLFGGISQIDEAAIFEWTPGAESAGIDLDTTGGFFGYGHTIASIGSLGDLGIEIDVASGGNSDDIFTGDPPCVDVANDGCALDVSWIATVRAVASIDTGGALSPFATIGLAATSASGRVDEGACGGGFGNGCTFDDNFVGATLGFGANLALAKGWGARAEILWYDFGDLDFEPGDNAIGNLAFSQVRLGLSKSF